MGIKREIALQIQKRSLNAVVELNTLLTEIRGKCSDDDYNAIKRGVGLSIGKIQMELLEVINSQHPEIDDLRTDGLD